MPTAFFGSAFFGGEFFSVSEVAEVARSGGGGIDPVTGKRRQLHLPFKPTGFIDRPKAKTAEVQKRLDQSVEVAAEVAQRLAREFAEETEVLEHPRPIVQMTMQEVEAEIGILLRKKLRTEEEEVILLLLIAAAGES